SPPRRLFRQLAACVDKSDRRRALPITQQGFEQSQTLAVIVNRAGAVMRGRQRVAQQNVTVRQVSAVQQVLRIDSRNFLQYSDRLSRKLDLRGELVLGQRSSKSAQGAPIVVRHPLIGRLGF